MQAKWDKPAELMLDRRDRFTRPVIESEFESFVVDKQLLERSIRFDPDNDGYVTPVFHDRFSVVWYLEDETPVVRAVVPTARFDREDPDLKSRVKKIVQQASENKIALP